MIATISRAKRRVPASLTTRYADFRTLSALPSYLTGTDLGTGQAAPTFDANGMSLSIASAASAGRYAIFGEEIPDGASFVDFFIEDFICTSSAAYRELRCGLTSAPASSAPALQLDQVFIGGGLGGAGGAGNGAATSPSGSTAGVEGALRRAMYKNGSAITTVSGQDTRTFNYSERHPGLGYGTTTPNKHVHLGMRWFVNAGKMFTLAEHKFTGGTEIEPIYVDPEFQAGGARRAGRPIRPYLALLGTANQACVQRIGAFRYRFG